MKWWEAAAAALVLVGSSAGALAQKAGQANADSFVKAVREQDNANAMDMLRENPGLIDARGDKGQTALIAAIGERDPEWTAFLLSRGADPNFTGEDGDRPLIAAARAGFEDGAMLLLEKGAKVDATNKRGETALIVAVQRKQPAIVKLLLGSGADPDKNDSFAGYSARDYALQDTRSRDIIKLIEAKKPPPRP
ncbi:ankyrin repeat domain-containing protein [Sphingomonas sinipercae]|uniref:Ankyrin repeat domain-containing protein n=1 Tax=Sphingomonas sinipercae TaxID=2714944 RepID=A0A6G7ZKM5_9SPHN|nr:ankyrin repeat domain-containing protein [Sphingomonas sinipercae]QIL01547.1 ankyrin repeat domain-containing protein [Sphingomonas sinipercae]